MNAYEPISRSKKIACAAVTLVIAASVLELVAGAMKFPDAETIAVREQVIATQSERAARIRELARGELRVADRATGARI